MDGLSIAASLTEIAPRLNGAVIRNIYHPTRMRFTLRLFAGEDMRLAIDLQEAEIRIPEKQEVNPEAPSAFTMFLRKHLKGGHVERVSQQGWDRVIEFKILRREGSRIFSYQLIAELVGMRGNLHLLREGVLLQSLRSDHRNQPGAPFHPLPCQEKLDPTTASPDELEPWLRGAAVHAPLITKHVDGIGKQTAVDLAASLAGEDPALELALRLKEWTRYVQAPNPHVLDAEARATFYPMPPPATAAASYQEALAAVLDREDEAPAAGPDSIARRLKRALKRRRRTIEKLEDWLSAADEADALKARADLLMIYQMDIPKGSQQASLLDPATDEEVVVKLDPSFTALENAQAWYRRAQRIRRGHPHVHARLRKIRTEISILELASTDHQQGLEIEAAAAGLIERKGKQKPPPKKAVPFREADVKGYRIWIGKSAAQNDALLRAAKADDLWMHVKDFAGSHLVIRTRSGEPVPDQVLEAAARLAAQHSKAKDERRAQVSVTEVRHVRKPRGAPAGLVNVRTADTLTVELRKGDS